MLPCSWKLCASLLMEALCFHDHGSSVISCSWKLFLPMEALCFPAHASSVLPLSWKLYASLLMKASCSWKLYASLQMEALCFPSHGNFVLPCSWKLCASLLMEALCFPAHSCWQFPSDSRKVFVSQHMEAGSFLASGSAVLPCAW